MSDDINSGDANHDHKTPKAEGEPKIDREPKAETSQALTPAVKEIKGVDPFIAAASEETAEAAAPRPMRAKLLDYSAHAAIVVGLLGLAWTIGDRVFSHPVAKAPEKVAIAPEKKVDEMAELRKANTQMASDMRSLRASLDSLRAVVKQDKYSGQIRSLENSLDGIKGSLASAKTETGSAIAQLSGKIDRLQRDPPSQSKMQQLVDRLGKLEHQSVDTTSTGSIDPGRSSTLAKSVPTPPTKPASAKSDTARTEIAKAETGKGESSKGDFWKNEPGADRKGPQADDGKPDVISGWVVRDVYDGVALVEGKHGPMEVVPGVTIPGAGVVRSIDRQGNGWTVTTSKGQLAYAASAPQRDYRRPRPRDFYAPPPYRYY